MEKPLRILRVIARIWGGLIIVFLTVMFLGNLFMPGEGAGPTTKEFIGFLFIPIGLIAGLALAFKYELIGGTITVVSFIIFCLYQRLFDVSDFAFYLSPIFLAMVFPGALYVIYGLFARID